MIVPLSHYVIVTGVGMCVVDALASTPAGTPGRICLHVPGEIAWDECECGSFTQTVNSWLWSDNSTTTIPEYRDSQNNCGPFYIGVDVTAVVLRCAPQPDTDNGQIAPTCEALDQAAQQWHHDAQAMRSAIACCLRDLLTANTIEGWQITNHVSVGPQGMCVGSQINYRFWLPNCDC